MNKEMTGKLQNAKSKEEIQTIAKEYGEELTLEQVEELQKRLSATEGELSDDEVEAVAGGRVWIEESSLR